MRSWDPMKNFPELDGLERREAETLRRQTQRKVSLRPAIFIGLLATTGVAALLAFGTLPTDTIWQSALAGASVGLMAVGYMVLVIKPRMKEEFRAMGYPRSGAAAPPQ